MHGNELAKDTVPFISSIFNETLTVLMDAHEYFDHFAVEDQMVDNYHNNNDADMWMTYSAEMSRITLRLTSVIAWFSVRRAVANGYIEETDAIANYPLEAVECCLMQEDETLLTLPGYMRHLAEQSYTLYHRVYVLDQQMLERYANPQQLFGFGS